MSDDSLSEGNKEVVRRFFEAGSRGDIETVLSLMADDIAIIQPPFIAYGGTYGKADFPALAVAMAQHIDMSGSRIERVVADGDVVITVQRVRELASGKECLLAPMMTLHDGKIVESRVFFNQAESIVRGPTAEPA